MITRPGRIPGVCAGICIAIALLYAAIPRGAPESEPAYAADAAPAGSIQAAARHALQALLTQAPLGSRHIALVYDITEGRALAALNEKEARARYFSPGSLMKVPALFYLLAGGGIDEKYMYNCTGRLYPLHPVAFRDELIHEDVREPLAGQWYKCSLQKGHGQISPVEAIAHSCNLFFMALHRHFSKDADTLRGFAAFCERYGLERAAKQIRDACANVTNFCTRDRLHLALGLPVQTSVYEIARFFSLLLRESASGTERTREEEAARAILMEGMREASRTGTAKALMPAAVGASPSVPGELLAKTGSGLVEDSVFKLNGWCVTAWPADKPRLVFVSFVQESFGAGLPLEQSRRFWQNFFAAQATSSSF